MSVPTFPILRCYTHTLPAPSTTVVVPSLSIPPSSHIRIVHRSQATPLALSASTFRSLSLYPYLCHSAAETRVVANTLLFSPPVAELLLVLSCLAVASSAEVTLLVVRDRVSVSVGFFVDQKNHPAVHDNPYQRYDNPSQKWDTNEVMRSCSMRLVSIEALSNTVCLTHGYVCVVETL